MASFPGEIKRRKVFQVAAAYAVVGWLLIEVASVLLPTFQAPDWVMRAFSFLVIAGFPLAVILAWAFDLTPQGIKAASELQAQDTLPQLPGQRFSFLIQGLILLAVVFLVMDQYLLRPEARFSSGEGGEVTTPNTLETPVRRSRINLLSTGRVDNTGLSAHLDISPDGKNIAYAADVRGSLMLHLRPLDQLNARVIPGTEGAQSPFFSRDGEWVGFFADRVDGTLKRVSIRDGLLQPLTEVSASPGASWDLQDSIVFSNVVSSGRNLFRIPATGGSPEVLLRADDEYGYAWPDVLPGGDAALVTLRPTGGPASAGNIGVLSFDTGEVETIIERGYNARYAPSGHLIFVRDTTLWAAPFDLSRLEKTGTEVPVLQNIQANTTIGNAAYAFSEDGLLVYVQSDDLSGDIGRRMVLVDREGREEYIGVPQRPYAHPRLSPDGQRIAVDINESGNQDIWVFELATGLATRVTFDQSAESHPLWSRDGDRIFFYSNRGNGPFWKAANGTGQTQPIPSEDVAISEYYPEAFSVDGSQLIFRTEERLSDLRIVTLEDGAESHALLETQFDEDIVAISPDGNWMAYESNETGRDEIFVRPFPNPGDIKIPVSTDGGMEPVWPAPGGELFYRNGNDIMVVEVQTDPEFSVGRREIAFSTDDNDTLAEKRSYDVLPGGDKAIFMRTDITTTQYEGLSQMVLVENWFEELRRLVPTAN